jgi:hypothetical protein
MSNCEDSETAYVIAVGTQFSVHKHRYFHVNFYISKSNMFYRFLDIWFVIV